jgi:hypothetical protein
MPRIAVFIAGLVALLGCAREVPYPEPQPPPAWGPYPWQAPAWNQQPVVSPQLDFARGRGERSLHIPDGPACLDWLSRHAIAFRVLEPSLGMTTPIQVWGPIGGIVYASGGEPSVTCDCRLAVALHWVAPELRALGITEVHHAGAYVYRTTRKGRLSLHALGLAIDVRDVRAHGRTYRVQENYSIGLRDGCAPQSPELNRLACRLDRTSLFKELLTPDDDRDHHDHLHLAIAPR